ncbi:MAG: ABC transporter permease [Chloroflexi bacterium]|nr:ABC transporter permease [Chloroflexota bacterium]
MTRYLVSRLIQLLVLAVIVVTIVFAAVRIVPGDPAMIMLGQIATPYEYESLKKIMGLDQPIPVQYVLFLKGLAVGDMGKSVFYGKPVMGMVVERLPATLGLAVVTMIWILLVGVPIGIYTACHQGSWADYIMRLLVYFTQAAATFWVAIMLILVFSVKLDLLPSFGSGTLAHVILPTTALGLGLVARVARFVRSGMLEVLGTDYVRTARGKGLAENRVMYGHAFRNVMIPLVTDTGLRFGWLLGGAVIVETVFSWPGLGSLTTTAVQMRDYQLVQGCVLVFALLFLVVNLLIDVSYTLIDPRIRYQK